MDIKVTGNGKNCQIFHTTDIENIQGSKILIILLITHLFRLSVQRYFPLSLYFSVDVKLWKSITKWNSILQLRFSVLIRISNCFYLLQVSYSKIVVI